MQNNTQQNHPKKDYWLKVCEDWQRSGETQLTYCQRLGIKMNTFAYWRAKFSDTNKKSKKTFVKVTPPALPSVEQEKPIIIQLLSGVKIILPAKIDKEQLSNILEILGVTHA